DTSDAATHGENRAEHAKDTRATEQSYLARGLAERVEDLRRTEIRLAGLQMRSFGLEDSVALTAVVRIRDEQTDEWQVWWLVPEGGGLEIAWGSETVRTLTPGSPLGRALIGLQVDDEGIYRTPRGERRFEVLDLL
ncbi:MAG: GreA/GreB family elongation factor, partial [Deltaproteobacteria bacterium]|nr:GreA/GreB family elongation factor [Deltaproteobacteria bacterium]